MPVPYDRFTAMTMRTELEKLSLHRQALKAVADSGEFLSSKQLRDFLLYVGEAALAGKNHVDQVEIAREVLHRRDDFNPVDDSSVRKLGSLLRQRLDRYYSSAGASDPIVISLPVRTYVPVFVERSALPCLPTASPGAVDGSELEELEVARPPRAYRWLPLAVGLFVLGGLAGFFLRPANPVPTLETITYELPTVRGDFNHKGLDLPGSAIQLGPEVGEFVDLIARMRFWPDSVGQQAGLLLFRDPDNYVRFARHFNTRTHLEFGSEIAGNYSKPPGTWVFDPSGQNGQPVWLSIRKQAALIQAFRSSDGEQWIKLSRDIDFGAGSSPTRIGIYANHSRTESPSTMALFDHVAQGLHFQGRADGPVNLDTFPGWRLESNCESKNVARLELGMLVFDLSGQQRCGIHLTRPIPVGDWSLATKIDYVPSAASPAGLFIRGSKTSARLVRWDANGGAIQAEFEHRWQINRPDFRGSPPLILRLSAKAGILNGSFSKDGLHYEDLPLKAPLADFGSNLVFGIQTTRSSWSADAPVSPARFSWVLQDVQQTANFR